ncbi:hypothetical protein CI102_6862 [Trichoderma harzianum]|jgi:hypothetical protein|nr:hypothetical protein CI102_6862 [Trichoderma harzianum]
MVLFYLFSHLHLLTFFHFHTHCSFSCSAQKHAKSERAVYIDGDRERLTDKTRRERMVSRGCGKKGGLVTSEYAMMK